jgi:putative glutamine amidotransferase
MRVRQIPAPNKVVISRSLGSLANNKHLVSILERMTDVAGTALQSFALEPHVVEAGTAHLSSEDVMEGAVGLVVLGGGDIDPSIYGQKAVSEAIYGVDRQADEFEIGLILGASLKSIPIFGICRGMQLLNVAQGGTLIQDLGPATPHCGSADNSALVDHSIDFVPGSRLSNLFGREAIAVRSGHHQAVGRLGENLRIAAVSRDSCIEAIEAQDERWIVGVQWHPDDPHSSHVHRNLLFGAFAAACRADIGS